MVRTASRQQALLMGAGNSIKIPVLFMLSLRAERSNPNDGKGD
jgi:hypothetical protein